MVLALKLRQLLRRFTHSHFAHVFGLRNIPQLEARGIHSSHRGANIASDLQDVSELSATVRDALAPPCPDAQRQHPGSQPQHADPDTDEDAQLIDDLHVRNHCGDYHCLSLLRAHDDSPIFRMRVRTFMSYIARVSAAWSHVKQQVALHPNVHDNAPKRCVCSGD